MAAQAGLAWTDLPRAQLEAIDAASPAEKIRRISDAVDVKHYADNSWSGVLVDFLYYGLMFAEERSLRPDQTSALFSILRKVFEFTFRPDSDADGSPRIEMAESFAFFKDQMLAHAVDAPNDGAVGLFSVPDVEAVAEFVSTTFYRHFKAYAYAFYHEQPDECVERALLVETPLAPTPLSEGFEAADAPVEEATNVDASAAPAPAPGADDDEPLPDLLPAE